VKSTASSSRQFCAPASSSHWVLVGLCILMAALGTALITYIPHNRHLTPPIESYIDILIEEPPPGQNTQNWLNKQCNEVCAVLAKQNSERLNCEISIWQYRVSEEGRANVRPEPTRICITPPDPKDSPIGSRVLAQRRASIWSSLSSEIVHFESPPATGPAPLFKQLQIIFEKRRQAQNREPAGVERDRETNKERDRNLLVIIASLEDTRFPADQPTEDWKHATLPWAAGQMPDIANTDVLVWQLPSFKRKASRLKNYWQGLFTEIHAHSLTFFCQTEGLEPKVPEDRVTAVFIDGSNRPSDADIATTARLLEATKSGEQVCVYSIDDRQLSGYPEPDAVITKSGSDDAFSDSLDDALRAKSSNHGTTTSPILEWLLSITQKMQASAAMARREWPDYPERVIRRLLICSDLQQNSTDTSLVLSGHSLWWQKPDAWQTFAASPYWRRNRCDLKGIEIHVLQLRRQQTYQAMAQLQDFWQALFEDAGSPVAEARWTVQQAALSSTNTTQQRRR
jgi:hypothetical protein